MQAKPGEHKGANERSQRHAHGAGGHIDRHGRVALPFVDDAARTHGAEGMVHAGAKAGQGGKRNEGGEGGGKADGRKGRRGPDQRQTNKACPVAVGQPAKEGL